MILVSLCPWKFSWWFSRPMLWLTSLDPSMFRDIFLSHSYSHLTRGSGTEVSPQLVSGLLRARAEQPEPEPEQPSEWRAANSRRVMRSRDLSRPISGRSNHRSDEQRIGGESGETEESQWGLRMIQRETKKDSRKWLFLFGRKRVRLCSLLICLNKLKTNEYNWNFQNLHQEWYSKVCHYHELEPLILDKAEHSDMILDCCLFHQWKIYHW